MKIIKLFDARPHRLGYLYNYECQEMSGTIAEDTIKWFALGWPSPHNKHMVWCKPVELEDQHRV